MKKSLLFLTLILFSIESFAKEFDAVLYQLNGDFLICKITDKGITIKEEERFILMAKKIVFLIDGIEVKKKASDASGFKIKVNNEWWIYESRLFRKNQTFMKKEVDGLDLRLFSFTDYNPFNTYVPFTSYHVIQKVKESQDLFLPTTMWSIKNKVLEYFDNCQEVSDKINEEKFNLKTMDGVKIVMEIYKQKCIKK